MGASDPTAIADLAKRLADEGGIDLIDAPALGTPAEARAGKLTLIIGGDPMAVERCRPSSRRWQSKRFMQACPDRVAQARCSVTFCAGHRSLRPARRWRSASGLV